MGLQFVDQRPACALFIEGARAFEYKKCTLDRKVFAAIVTNEGVWQLSCSCGGRGGGVWWEGEVCRSGEGMWDSAGNGTVVWHMQCVLMHHSDCLS